MEIVVERCAGLDVHKDVVVACVRLPSESGERETLVQSFSTYTRDLLALRDWLVALGVTRVGMEATGVYWKPVLYLLEDDLDCWLLNARHMRNVPGRKTDVGDAQWICQLTEHGLVRASFVPETATLDRLSHGRLILGVGLGSNNNNELEQFGEVVDPRERARRLDEGLIRLTEFWAGEFEPRPEQAPRIPIWIAARWPHRRPLERAARWDGVFPIGLPGPEAIADIATEITQHRNQGQGSFDLVIDHEPEFDPAPWERAGATWLLTDFGPQPRAAHVRRVIQEGPR